MLIQLENNTVIAQSHILSAIMRSDLVPVPVSLELQVRFDADLEKVLSEGSKLYITNKALALQIIKSEIKKSATEPNRGVIVVTAIFEPCVAIAYRRQKAVILKNNSLGAIFKACGAKISIKNDFTVPLFAAFVGHLPSEMIAKVLQEEAASVRLNAKQLEFVRLADLLKQKAKYSLAASVGENITSGFLERHSIPSFYTTDDNRAIVKGNTQKVRTLYYAPRHNQRNTHNMTSALVTKKILTLSYDDSLQAGDVVSIGDVPMAIVTAAHVWETEHEGEQAAQYSRLWLGELEV
jgi:hypothetical protein